MRVKAKDIGQKYSGYYGHRRRKPGDEFVLEPIKRLRMDAKTGQMREITISVEQQFSERWMERLDPPTTAKKPVKEAKPVEASVEEI